jgi:hypothetical protein
LKYTRTWLEVGSSSYSAIDAWSDAMAKHVGDPTPPRGAPVFWAGGSRGYGHVALSMGHGNIRSTDVPVAGTVSTVDLGWIGDHWGQQYLGWSADLNGVTIPYLTGEPGGVQPASRYASGTVYVAKLHRGQADSESVGRLCYRLMHHARIPDPYRPVRQTDNYGPDLADAVRYWQRRIGSGVNGPDDGSSMSNAQAHKLFGPHYDVISEEKPRDHHP